MKSIGSSTVLLLLFINYVDSARKSSTFSDKRTSDDSLIQSTKKRTNCEQINLKFIHNLLDQYNRDDEEKDRLKRLCNSIDRTKDHCYQTNLINFSNHHLSLKENEPDFYHFSQAIFRLCPLRDLFRTKFNPPKCLTKKILQSTVTDSRRLVWIYAFLFVIICSNLFLLIFN